MISMWTLRNFLPRASTVIFADGIKESGTVLTMLGFANVYAGILQAAGVGEYIVGMLSNTSINLLWLALILLVALHAGTGAGTVAGSTAISLFMSTFVDSGASLMAFGLICGDTVKAVCIPSTIAGVVSFILILIMNSIGTFPMWF